MGNPSTINLAPPVQPTPAPLLTPSSAGAVSLGLKDGDHTLAVEDTTTDGDHILAVEDPATNGDHTLAVEDPASLVTTTTTSREHVATPTVRELLAVLESMPNIDLDKAVSFWELLDELAAAWAVLQGKTPPAATPHVENAELNEELDPLVFASASPPSSHSSLPASSASGPPAHMHPFQLYVCHGWRSAAYDHLGRLTHWENGLAELCTCLPDY